MTTAETPAGTQLPSEELAEQMLPRVLGSLDLVAIFAAIVLFITNAAVIQSAGPAAFGWWILGFALFLVPGAIVTGQLGRMFPSEGSIYIWTQRALGSFWGYFAGFCAWWPGVLVMVVTATIAYSFLGYLAPDALNGLDIRVQGLAISAIIVIAALLATLRFRATLSVVNVFFGLYLGAIVLMGLAGVAWLAGGHAAQTDPFDFAAYAPSSAGGLNLGNWSFFGLAILALLGVEVPLNMGAEIREGRSITRYLVVGSIVVMAAYLIATFGVMVVLPADGSSAEVTAVAAAVGAGLGDGWATLVALILAGSFVVMTAVYNFSFARLLLVFGLDRHLPPSIARLNANGVPANAVWAQTVVAVAFALLAFDVLPSVMTGGSAVDVQTQVYDVLEAAVTVIWCISMVILFLDGLIVVRRFRAHGNANRVAHPAIIDISAVIGAIVAIVGIVATLSGSWTPLIPNDTGAFEVLGATIAYGPWAFWVAGIAVASLAVGAGWYVVAYRRGGR